MRPATSAVLLISLFASLSALATPQLVSLPNGVLPPRSSNPQRFIRAGNQVFFIAGDGVHGAEVWRTDGTADGTRMVTDFDSPLTLTFAGTIANSVIVASSRGVWRSDGTSSGTVLLFETPLNATTYVTDGRVFIIVSHNNGEREFDLWVSDGTPASTRLVKTLRFGQPSGANPVATGGKLYFLAGDPVLETQLWVSDGTPAGTHMVFAGRDCFGSTCGPVPSSMFGFAGRLYFNRGDELWSSDGTAAGIAIVPGVPNVTPIAASATTMYAMSPLKIWRIDSNGASSSVSTPVNVDRGLILDDGRLIFVDQSNHELWRTDGATLTSLGAWPRREPYLLGALGKRVFLAGQTTAAGAELWSVDADAANAALFADLDPRTGVPLQGSIVAASGLPSSGVTLGSQFIFAATDSRGRELWVTDGTAAGTRLLKNINPEVASGMVSGTVRDAATDAPVAGADVYLCDTTCTQRRTDGAGRYRFEGAEAGQYHVRVFERAHLPQALGVPECWPCTATSGTTIEVKNGFETSAVDFSLHHGGAISGTVTRATAPAQIGDVRVTIYDAAGQPVDTIVAETATMWTSRDLPAGTYYVGVEASSLFLVRQLYRGIDCVTACTPASGTPVNVTVGTTTSGIDFALADYGRLSGQVIDATSDHGAGSAVVSFESSSGSIGSVETEADGSYVSPPLAPGSYYVSAAHSTGLFPRTYYPATVCASTPCDHTNLTTVAVQPSATVSGIDIRVTPNYSGVFGFLRDANGVPLPNVTVALIDATNAGKSTVTEASGRFRIVDVPSGNWYLLALGEVYPNVDCPSLPCNLAGATALTVAEKKTTYVEMQSRSRLTRVSGTIVDAVTGKPVESRNLDVTLFDADGGIQDYVANPTAGVYDLSAITRSPTLSVTAQSPAYHPTTISVAAGIHPDTDIRMTAYGTVTGKVVDAVTGAPVAGATVAAHDGNTTLAGAETAADGTYRLPVAGAVYVVVWQYENYQPQLYRELDCGDACRFELATRVTVPDGQEMTGVDFHLSPFVSTGRITGRVVDDVTGEPLSNVTVVAFGENNVPHEAQTDANGIYTIADDSRSGILTGNYQLYAVANRGSFFVGRYGATACETESGCDLRGGSSVQVTAPATTSGIDFRLPRIAITGITPASGPATGGTVVTIHGVNFTTDSHVSIGGREATVVSATPTEIVVQTPPADDSGYAHVTVTRRSGLSATIAQGFRYIAGANRGRSVRH